jgi:DNA-directed RNA polymerase subunit M/transcription elongation factor TFIIS
MGKGPSKCSRCGGMMIHEKIFHETEHFWAWKCVYCGECIDRVILENRQFQEANRAKRGRKNQASSKESYLPTPSA